ncbi:MAG: hypothetical protein ACI3W6_08360 [Clostridia bacterium]
MGKDSFFINIAKILWDFLEKYFKEQLRFRYMNPEAEQQNSTGAGCRYKYITAEENRNRGKVKALKEKKEKN